MSLLRIIAGLAGAACVTAAVFGDTLVTQPFEVAPPAAARRNDRNWYPETAFNDGRWLVAWAHSTLDPVENVQARGAVVAADGTLLTPFAVGISIQQSYPWQIEEIDVAPLGDGFFVVWTMLDTHDENSITMVQGVRVNRDGVPLDSPVELNPRGSLARFPQLASAGNRCLVAWIDDIQHDGTIELRGCVVDSEGPLENPVVRDLSPPGLAQNAASIAAAGGKFLAVWTEFPTSGPSGIRGAFIGLDGIPGGPFPIAASGFESDPDLAPLGDGFVVVWSDFWRDFGPGVGEFGEIKATRINASGQLLDSPPLDIRPNPVNDSVLFTDVTGDAASALIVWTETDKSDGSSVVRARRMQPDGSLSPSPGEIVAEDDDQQIFDPTVAPGPAGWLFARTETASQPVNGSWPSQIQARLLNVDATPDGAPFVISATATEMQALSVAARPGGFVAVWQDDRNAATTGWDLRAQQFLPNGTPDGAAFVLAGGGGDEISPVVAAGAGLAFAWTLQEEIEIPNGVSVRTSVWATVIDPSAPLAPTRLSHPDVDARAPSIAFAGGKFFVVWRQFSSLGGHDIFGVALPSNGAPPAQPFAICNHPARQSAPAVAGNAAGFLVAWRDGREERGRDAIYASFLPGGAPPANTNGFAVAPGIGHEQYAPEIAAQGERFLVVWRQTLPGPQDQGRVAAVRIGSAGQLIDPAPVLVAADPSLPLAGHPVREPAVAGFDGGWVIGWHQDSKIHGARIFDEPVLRAGDPFVVVEFGDFERDTLSIAAVGESVMLGFVRDPHPVMAALAFPKQTVPDLNIFLAGPGTVSLSIAPHPYFPLVPESIDVSFDARAWQPLPQSPLTWSPGPASTILITAPASGSFNTRLRASFGGQ